MAFPSEPTNDEQARADFRSMSDQDFARLCTEDKFQHINHGMRELVRALDELAGAKTAGRLYGDE